MYARPPLCDVQMGLDRWMVVYPPSWYHAGNFTVLKMSCAPPVYSSLLLPEPLSGNTNHFAVSRVGLFQNGIVFHFFLFFHVLFSVGTVAKYDVPLPDLTFILRQPVTIRCTHPPVSRSSVFLLLQVGYLPPPLIPSGKAAPPHCRAPGTALTLVDF